MLVLILSLAVGWRKNEGGGGASASGPRKENKGVHKIKNQPLPVTFIKQAQNMSHQRAGYVERRACPDATLPKVKHRRISAAMYF